MNVCDLMSIRPKKKKTKKKRYLVIVSKVEGEMIFRSFIFFFLPIDRTWKWKNSICWCIAFRIKSVIVCVVLSNRKLKFVNTHLAFSQQPGTMVYIRNAPDLVDAIAIVLNMKRRKWIEFFFSQSWIQIHKLNIYLISLMHLIRVP